MFVIHSLLLVNMIVHRMHISVCRVNVALWSDWPRLSLDPILNFGHALT